MQRLRSVSEISIEPFLFKSPLFPKSALSSDWLSLVWLPQAREIPKNILLKTYVLIHEIKFIL